MPFLIKYLIKSCKTIKFEVNFLENGLKCILFLLLSLTFKLINLRTAGKCIFLCFRG